VDVGNAWTSAVDPQASSAGGGEKDGTKIISQSWSSRGLPSSSRSSEVQQQEPDNDTKPNDESNGNGRQENSNDSNAPVVANQVGGARAEAPQKQYNAASSTPPAAPPMPNPLHLGASVCRFVRWKESKASSSKPDWFDDRG